RMVTVSVILSLLPALLLFFLAYGLINFSIEQWFSAPAEQMLENSKAITEQYYEETEQRSRHAAASVASSMESEELISPGRRGLQTGVRDACIGKMQAARAREERLAIYRR